MHNSKTSGTSHLHLKSISIALVALGGAVAIAACGGSNPKATASSNAPPPLALAACMRSHGVPNFPDPTAGPGEGVPFSV
jgi:hypothetical protein